MSAEFIDSNVFVCLFDTGDPARQAAARTFLDDVLAPLWRVYPSVELYHRALDVRIRYGFSFYDSLVVAAAVVAGYTALHSEGLQAGQRIDGLTVVNPFAA